MASKVNCLVTTSDEGRGAFAIRVDNDESVYIPQGIAERLELEEFDEVLAIIVKNQRADPPWMPIKAKRLGEDEDTARDEPAPPLQLSR